MDEFELVNFTKLDTSYGNLFVLLEGSFVYTFFKGYSWAQNATLSIIASFETEPKYLIHQEYILWAQWKNSASLTEFIGFCIPREKCVVFSIITNFRITANYVVDNKHLFAYYFEKFSFR